MLPDPALASPWLPDPDGDWVGEVSPSPIRESVSGAERGEAELKEEPWLVGGILAGYRTNRSWAGPRRARLRCHGRRWWSWVLGQGRSGSNEPVFPLGGGSFSKYVFGGRVKQ